MTSELVVGALTDQPTTLRLYDRSPTLG